MNATQNMREITANVIRQPLMWVSREEYYSVVDFLVGYDIELILYKGFHDWLVEKLQLNTGAIPWPWMVLQLLPGEDFESSRAFPDREKELIQGFGSLIAVFLDEMEETVFDGNPSDAEYEMSAKLDAKTIVKHVTYRSLMCVTREEFYAVVDFLNGYDTSSGLIGLREGFRGWLLKRLQIESADAWPELALMLLPGYDPMYGGKMFPDREKELIHGLGDLLLEYLDWKESAESLSEG